MHRGRTIHCLLFDLGSTLWTRDEAASIAESRAHARAGDLLRRATGNALFPALDEIALGALLQHTIAGQRHARLIQRPGYEPDAGLVTMGALQQLGMGKVDRGVAEDLFEALRVRIPVSRALFADALSTLEALKRAGYLLGVVTNRSYGGSLFREDVEAMGLLGFFEYRHMAISADLGVCKPHPAIFTHALNGLNVSPLETAMVGNDLEADIAGARGLNMLAVWKGAAARTAQERHTAGAFEPDIEIQQLSQLLEVF